MSPAVERRLTTVLAADVAGYTRLMSLDEEATMAALRALRVELLEPQVSARRGRIVKLMGDGALVEFPSVVDAVRCAVEIQQATRERGRGAPPDKRILLRIGINLGDVIAEGDDLYGDGVNVAFRLQGLAEPGGIVVSREVRNEARDRLPYGFAGMGEVAVKNHPRPLKPYRLLEDGPPACAEPAPPVAPASVPPRSARRRRQAPADATALSEPPAIAVLPFTDMSGNPEAAYLGQGVAEDILTALSASPELRVLARTTSFATDLSQPAEAIGRRLGARYVLEGSVRKLGEQVRVTARLIDAETGGHVWAERFDETGKDVLAIQAGVAERVLGAVAGSYGDLGDELQRLAWAKTPVALGEYDFFLRGDSLLKTGGREDAARARAVSEEGLAKHPGSALLRTQLGFCSVRRLFIGASDDPVADIAEMARLAAEARAMPDRSKLAMWLGRWLEAYVAFFRQDWPATYAAASKAVALVPHDVWARGDLASVIAPAGYQKEGVEWADRAARIDPQARPARVGLIWAHLLGGDPARAVAAAEGLNEATTGAIAALVRLGRIEEARAANARLQAEWGGRTIAQEAALPMHPSLKPAYLDDLRKAGMPAG